ncbi:IS3 family transposase [Streptomyces sp. NPDC056661]|uniref:IS3 family transposase n=1 Tax=Streptomyces sp. NPDC056661 TaxID=3345898 RepID=UPI003689CDE8
MTTIHTASHGSYGIRRVHAELKLGHGISINHVTVMLLMQRAGLKGLPGNRRRWPRHNIPTPADLVNRNFARTAPDKLCVTDILPTRPTGQASSDVTRSCSSPGHLLAPSSPRVHRLHPDLRPRHQRPEHGDQ